MGGLKIDQRGIFSNRSVLIAAKEKSVSASNVCKIMHLNNVSVHGLGCEKPQQQPYPASGSRAKGGREEEGNDRFERRAEEK